MPTLLDLQSDFRRFLTGEACPQLLQVVDGIGFESESRLSIYRNNTIATLTGALKATFPVVCRLVDDRFFDYAAHAFIQHNLPASPCLVEYGGDFPTFLAGFPAAADLDYLPDVARLEWAINQFAVRPIPKLPSRSCHCSRCRAIRRKSVCASRLASNILLRRTRSIASGNSTSPATRLPKWCSTASVRISRSVMRMGRRSPICRRPSGRSEPGSQVATTLGAATADALAIAPDFDLAQALATLFNAGSVWAILRSN